MSSTKYSDIYEGNWSYSFYGGEQGIVFTERKIAPFSSFGEAFDLVSKDNNMRNAPEVGIGTRLSVRTYPTGLGAMPRSMVSAEKNGQYDTGGMSPATPRAGTRQPPVKRVELRNNTPGLTVKNKSTQELKIVDNFITTGNIRIKHDGHHVNRNNANEETVEKVEISPDTPRSGTGQTLARHLHVRNNAPGLALDKRHIPESEKVENMKRTETITIGPGGEDMVKRDVNARTVDDDGIRSSKAYGRTEEEIEELRKRLRQKSNKRETDRAQQRALLSKWVVAKSGSENKDTNQTRCRSKSTSDTSRSERATSLDDIAEDEGPHSDEGRIRYLA